MKKLSKKEAIDKFGENIVNKAMKTNAEPTSRVMYPSYEVASHIGKAEYAGDPVKVGGWKLTAYCFNCTFMELKFGRIHVESFCILLVLIVPLWN